jgi:hypothetical protein
VPQPSQRLHLRHLRGRRRLPVIIARTVDIETIADDESRSGMKKSKRLCIELARLAGRRHFSDINILLTLAMMANVLGRLWYITSSDMVRWSLII